MSKSLKRNVKGTLLAGAFVVLCSAGYGLAAPLPDGMEGAEVVLLGEVHDNPDHHRTQARLVSKLAPRAVVWEMLTAEQAAAIEPQWLSDLARLEQELNWQASGWPDFALYAPVFQAAAEAVQFGAQVPRAAAGEVMSGGAAAYFGADAARFGLGQPLSDAEQSAREADQQASHCNAMPEEMLPLLVDFQRLRDAALARAVDAALTVPGAGPVVVITGNGHARRDRGAAVYLEQARPDVAIHALGQSEAGLISGEFDSVLDAPAVTREDPCKAFEKN